MGYQSPIDGAELTETKNSDGDTVYRDRSTGTEYTEEQLKEQKAEEMNTLGAPSEGSSEQEDDAEQDDSEKDDLDGLKRGELNDVATAEGLNPEDYSNADDLRAAIKANRA